MNHPLGSAPVFLYCARASLRAWSSSKEVRSSGEIVRAVGLRRSMVGLRMGVCAVLVWFGLDELVVTTWCDVC